MFKGVRLYGDAIRLMREFKSAQRIAASLIDQGHAENIESRAYALIDSLDIYSMKGKELLHTGYRLIKEGNKRIDTDKLNGVIFVLSGIMVGNWGVIRQSSDALKSGEINDRQYRRIYKEVEPSFSELDRIFPFLSR
ncbi:MAG: hypothetical protein JSU75_05130 [Gammaproteobacteria bacterium]|nr:MAG: hypothetical protein JSU75_05130 [Gammaproteobacteria bacterium]